MRIAAIIWRILGSVGVVAAVGGQLALSISYWTETGVRHLPTSVANFFSFFTVQSNLIGAAALAIGAVLLIRGRDPEPRWFTVLRACATSYLLTTGLVYNLLLRGIELPQGSTLAWSNEVLHVVIPLVMVLDWVLAPGDNRIGWGAIGVVVIYPIVWAAYTMVRGPLVFSDITQATGWYPYPFLDPANGGWGSVLAYIAGIAALIAVAAAGVVAVSRGKARTPQI